jgi:hypothetical protein
VGVVFEDLDTAGAELSEFGGEVVDSPCRLCLLVGCAGRAGRQLEPAGAAALEHDHVVVLGHDLQPQLLGMELP